MEFADHAPVAAPSLEQQRDALRQGLGRAMQWARTGHLDDAPLLEACVQDQRFDMDVEDARGAWLWDIIQSVNAKARFRETILAVLRKMPEGRDACQLCELGFHYAVSGDETFRTCNFMRSSNRDPSQIGLGLAKSRSSVSMAIKASCLPLGFVVPN